MAHIGDCELQLSRTAQEQGGSRGLRKEINERERRAAAIREDENLEGHNSQTWSHNMLSQGPRILGVAWTQEDEDPVPLIE